MAKLKKRIVDCGFVDPICIWKNKDINYILDGTQRDKALKSLMDDGYTIPLIPVVYIQAKDETEAKEIILSISSQYGEIDETELNEWLDNMGDDIKKSFRLLDHEIDLGISEENIETRAPDSSEKERCPECGQTIKENNNE